LAKDVENIKKGIYKYIGYKKKDLLGKMGVHCSVRQRTWLHRIQKKWKY